MIMINASKDRSGNLAKIEECNDAEIISDVLRKSFITVADEFGFTVVNAPYFTAFTNSEKIQQKLDNGFKVFAYRMNEKIVGTVGFYRENDRHIIERLAVLPEYRHRKIGVKLMEFVENKIKEDNGKIIQLSMVDNNSVLKEWYIKLGYKLIEIKDKKIAFKIAILEKKIT